MYSKNQKPSGRKFLQSSFRFHRFGACHSNLPNSFRDQTSAGSDHISVGDTRTNVLSQVKSAINVQRPKVSTSRTLLLRDNASPHKARVTTQSLRDIGIQALRNPAYSPDLAPCDFRLFPIRKDRLAGRKFDRIQDLAKAVTSELRTMPEEDYQGMFRKWQIRLKRCIESHGEYFEGL
ncbi:transposase [Elysia marginata]|uniref:Transposase n=1 Tax=Elysia marginata TaxID=1093978 RepID=A0AAV4K4F1_9GAST|nr:transposase [Elysia marginata]